MLSKSKNCLRDENDRTEWNFNLKNWYKWQKINNFMATELITRLADWWRDEIFGGHAENFVRNEKCFIWCWLLFAITRKARKKFLEALGLRFIVCRAADKKWEILNHNSHRVRPTFCHANPYLFKSVFPKQIPRPKHIFPWVWPPSQKWPPFIFLSPL